MRRFIAVGMMCALVVPAGEALAQFSPGARSVGMGGAGLVFARGVDAIEWNPANLAMEGGWEVSLGEVGAAALITGVSVDDMIDIFEAGGSGNDALLARVPSQGLSFATVGEGFAIAKAMDQGNLPQPGSPYPSLGVAFGSFGLRVRSQVRADATLSKELVDLMVNGFSVEELQNYKVGNTGYRSASFSEITASYGLTIGGLLGLGVGARYVKGHSLTQGKFFEPVIDLNAETADVTGVVIESNNGNGFGMDVGLALDLPLGLRISGSATNIVQRMTWDDNLVAHEATFRGCDPADPACVQDDFDSDFDELVDRFQGTPIDPSAVSVPVYEAAEGLFEGSYAPTVIRGGVGWRAGGTTLELVGTTVSPRGRFKNAWDERVSLGLEQRLWIFRFRGGVARASDGIQAYSGGLGLAFGPVNLDVAGGIIQGDLEGLEHSGGQLTLGLSVRGGGR